MHVGEMAPDLRSLESMHRNTERNADRHDDQDNTEDRIDLADDLVNRDKGGDEIVQQNNCQPGRGLCKRAGNTLLRQQLDKQTSRSDCEHGTNHDQQNNRKYSHNGVHDRPKIDARYFGDRSTVISLGKHTGEVIMHRTGKNRTERDPQEYDRSPQRALHGTEDRAKAGDVQKLHQKQLPGRHDNVVNTVIDRDSRCFPVIRSEGIVYELAVGEVSAYQNQQTYNKAYHTQSLLVFYSPPLVSGCGTKNPLRDSGNSHSLIHRLRYRVT